MNLSKLLMLTVIIVLDVLIIASLIPWLINYVGTLGMIAAPFVFVLMIWFSYAEIKSMFFSTTKKV